MSNLGKGGDALPHDHRFLLAIKDLLDCDGPCGAGVDHAFIIFNRNKHAHLVKHRPMIADDCVDPLLEGGVQVQQVHICTHQRLVLLGDKRQVVGRINSRLKIWLRMTQLPEDKLAVHTMKHVILVIGLVGEPSVVQEYILQTLAAFWLGVHPNR